MTAEDLAEALHDEWPHSFADQFKYDVAEFVLEWLHNHVAAAEGVRLRNQLERVQALANDEPFDVLEVESEPGTVERVAVVRVDDLRGALDDHAASGEGCC